MQYSFSGVVKCIFVGKIYMRQEQLHRRNLCLDTAQSFTNCLFFSDASEYYQLKGEASLYHKNLIEVGR